MFKYILILFIAAVILFNNSTFAGDRYKRHSQMFCQDTSWNSVNDNITLLGQLEDKKDHLNSEETSILREYYFRKIRQVGLDYWNTHPINDRNRYDWLLTTINCAPTYYNYVLNRFDNAEKAKWDKLYPMLRSEYVSSVGKLVPVKEHVHDRFNFEVSELYSTIINQKFIFQKTGKKVDLKNYLTPFINLTQLAKEAHFKNSFSYSFRAFDALFTDLNGFGLSYGEVIPFLSKLKEKNIPELTSWADGKSRMLNLKENSLQFSFYNIDGNLVDISKMKDKVILIDFWATWCSVCLEYMPTVKEIFNKYNSKGFEVISISVNKNSEKEQVLAAEKKLAVSWPLGIIGDNKLKNEVWKKFGFTSVPQLLLLGRTGKLIEYNGQLMTKETLDQLVGNALKE